MHWAIEWMQIGAKGAFAIVGFLLIAIAFLPMFAVLLSLIGRLLAGMREDDDDDVIVYEEPTNDASDGDEGADDDE